MMMLLLLLLRSYRKRDRRRVLYYSRAERVCANRQYALVVVVVVGSCLCPRAHARVCVHMNKLYVHIRCMNVCTYIHIFIRIYRIFASETGEVCVSVCVC